MLDNEERLLQKMIAAQCQMIRDYQEIVIPMYVERILKLEEELKDCLIQGGVYND
jgi:hypothetical protein